jgi:glutamyl/glutaminyl-tRNA synthetase
MSPDLASSSLYRGRLAPSPTGYLHIGHARTFLTAFERARGAAGTLVMRMEDLDLQRSRAVYAEAALEDLRWLGIKWQEGPDVGGPFAPYEQSRRNAIYLAAWKRLFESGLIYPCCCSRKDLEAALSAPHEAGIAQPVEDDEPVYPGICRKYLDAELREAGFGDRLFDSPEGLNWRFAVPEGETVEFNDENLGVQRFVAGRDFGDFLVWRRDNIPSYQLACVVDDAAMQITEVVRGADLLKSTARQILLNRALRFEDPLWRHCRLIVDSNGQRLAKRNDALSIRTLRERGLTPAEVLSQAREASAEEAF